MSEPIPEYGGCRWPVDPACFEASWGELDAEVQDRALALASSTLERLTGYRVGNCPTTIRPCVRAGCWSAFLPFRDFGYGWINPGVSQSGSWVNACGCNDQCASACEIPLPPPVGRIDRVEVDGVEIDSTDYRVDATATGPVLVWQGDDDCPWPQTQDYSKPLGDAGTFGITYLNAYPVDQLGAWQVGVLAMEFAKACMPKTACALPLGVTQIVRNGVSMSIPTGAFPDGKTGMRTVDAYIGLWNPDGLRQEAQVFTPGQRKNRTTIIGGP